MSVSKNYQDVCIVSLLALLLALAVWLAVPEAAAVMVQALLPF